MEDKGQNTQVRTIDDYKRWYMEECDKVFHLEEKVKKLQEMIKAQAEYIANN